MNKVAKTVLCFMLAAATWAAVPESAKAGPFAKTTVIEGTYLMGTQSIEEFDAFSLLYPDYADSFAFTFSKTGKALIFDESSGTQSGVYKRFSGNSRITVTVTSTQSPYGTVTFELYRVGNTAEWWGEVRLGGEVWGHFRGTLQ